MMSYSENREFFEDLQAVIKKHGLTIMYSNNPTHLAEQTKGLEGYTMFFTKGEKKRFLQGGEGMPSNLTIKFSRNNTEDDGC